MILTVCKCSGDHKGLCRRIRESGETHTRAPARGNTASIRGRGASNLTYYEKSMIWYVERRLLMPFSITQLPSDDKLCRTLSWPMLEQFFPRQRIEQLVETYGNQPTRVRKLSMVLVVWILNCWHLYLRHS